MGGFELRIWRRGMNWDQERAAEELGVSLRSYKRYEKANEVARQIELATFALSIKYTTYQEKVMKKKLFQMSNKSHYINPDHIVSAFFETDGTFTITLSTGEKLNLDKNETQYLLDVFDFENPL